MITEKELFDMSKKNKGYIYFIKVSYGQFSRPAKENIPDDFYYIENGKKFVNKKYRHLFKTISKYKYGKTKNLEQRMNSYKKKYGDVEIIDSYKVDHMSLREDDIKGDEFFSEERRWGGSSEWLEREDEDYVSQVRKLIKRICESKIKLEKSVGYHIRSVVSYYYEDSKDWWQQYDCHTLTDLLRIKHN